MKIKRKILTFVVIMILSLMPLSVNAEVLFSEDFENYQNTFTVVQAGDTSRVATLDGSKRLILESELMNDCILEHNITSNISGLLILEIDKISALSGSNIEIVYNGYKAHLSYTNPTTWAYSGANRQGLGNTSWSAWYKAKITINTQTLTYDVETESAMGTLSASNIAMGSGYGGDNKLILRDSYITDLGFSAFDNIKLYTEASPAPTSSPAPSSSPEVIAGTVNVQFKNSDGDPLVGYPVELHSDPMTTVTKSNGRAVFNNVPIGNHTLYIKDKANPSTTLGQVGLNMTTGSSSSTSVSGSNIGVVFDSNTNSVNVDLVVGGSGLTISNVYFANNVVVNPQTGEASWFDGLVEWIKAIF